jgi:hypothetical protein
VKFTNECFFTVAVKKQPPQGGREMKRYVVGTRDTDNTYRAIRVEALTVGEAKQIAVRRLEDCGVYGIAISCRPITALGTFS